MSVNQRLLLGDFPRNIDDVLRNWSQDADRKPLVLRGARQTGKSSSVRELGKQFELFMELNLERFADLSLVRSCSDPQELLAALAARNNIARFPDRTLLFLDEIQESSKAIGWLRFLWEDHPKLAVVAAGSLMEVRLQERGFSFPVGRVTFRTLHPFTFFEFLRALGKDVLQKEVVESALHGRPAPTALHEQAMRLLIDYLRVGGMPEAVSRWAHVHTLPAVRQVHADLVQALAEDLQKYRGVRDLAYLEAAFENLKHHYGTRFKYENFAPGYRSQLMKAALGKLEGALLVTRIWPTSALSLPLRIRPKSAPKLLPLDIGVALFDMQLQTQPQPRSRILEGRVAEILVGQQVLAARRFDQESLHFWVNESSRSSAEVDLLLPGPDAPVPVEVKAGASGSLKSLHQFLWRSGKHVGLRFHAGTYADEPHRVAMPDGTLHYRLLSLPLYLAEVSWDLLEQLGTD
jgi:predicted AAA+ superfamily ATPase